MSELFGAVFSRGAAAEAVSDAAWLRAMLQVEKSIAEVAAEAGAVSAEAAEAVAEAAVPERFDLAEVAASAARIGNPVAGVVDRLKAIVPPEHHNAVHFGATSQDVLDTAMMLVARDAMAAIDKEFRLSLRAVFALRRGYGETPMMGRTLLQRAAPVEFKNVLGAWINGLAAAREAVEALDFPLSYQGPVGAYAIGRDPRTKAVHRALGVRLGLKTDVTWHTARNPVVRIGAAAAEAAGACGKVAVDVILLSQNEVGEVSEGNPGGSTSMPHKRNPVAATSARACAARTPGLLATLYAAMPQELQRSPGLWHSEWETLSDLLRLTGSSAAWIRDCLEHLRVHPDAMRRNREGGPV
ncbi:lyase family protein [Glycomyces sp. NPDC048151]|uniref:lyase family protein n=1 Tax=Glycomyces sp. NPDC048151 TaxID=3364002 RepID=UPI003719EB8A